MHKIFSKNLALKALFGLAVFVVTGFAFAGQAQAADTLPATNISNNAVTLNGVIYPQGMATTFWFEYGTTQSLGQTTSRQDAGSPNAPINVYNTIYGLAPNTTYYFRVDAQNSFGGFGQGNILSFYTGNNGGCNGGNCCNNGNCNGGSSSVNTGPAQPNGNSALLNGDVNPQGSNTQVWFSYGQNSGSLNNTTNVASVFGNNSQNFSQYALNLVSGTTYYYQAVAQNQFGTNYGQVLSFTVPFNNNNPNFPQNSQAPSVSTDAASAVGRTAATFNSVVNPNGSLAAVWFEYGRTTGLGSVTTRDPAGSGNSQTNYSTTITGLAAGTTYYYRAVVQSPAGTNFGQIASFRTQSAPTSPTPTPTPNPTPTSTPSGSGSGTTPTPEVPAAPIGAPGCLVVSPAINAPQLGASQDFTYSVTYRNACGTALSNASMQVTLPMAVDFAATNYPFLTRDGNVITYNIGVIAPNLQATFTVNGKVKAQVNNGDSLIFQANLTFTDPRGSVQTASGFLTAVIANTVAVTPTDASSTLGASVADNLSGLFHSGWFWLVLFLILLALFVFWLATRRREGEDEDEGLAAHGAH